MMYETRETMAIPDIMQLLLDNQGGRTPTLGDIVRLHNFSRWSIKREMKQTTRPLQMLPTIAASIPAALMPPRSAPETSVQNQTAISEVQMGANLPAMNGSSQTYSE